MSTTCLTGKLRLSSYVSCLNLINFLTPCVWFIDVTKTEEIENIASKTAEIFSNDGLNLLVNNAGIAHKKQFLGNLNKQHVFEQFDVNIFGPVLLTQVIPMLYLFLGHILATQC